MAISRQKKETLVQKYVDLLNESDGIIISEYRGLTVGAMEQLRAKIREAEGSFAVVKNTLARRALDEVGWSAPDEMLFGPVGISFGHRNLAGIAKVMTQFAKDNEVIIIKGGIIGQSVIDASGVNDLANMPPIEVLQAQLLGVLGAPGSQLARLLNTPATQMVNVLSGSVRQLVNVFSAYSKQQQATE